MKEQKKGTSDLRETTLGSTDRSTALVAAMPADEVRTLTLQVQLSSDAAKYYNALVDKFGIEVVNKMLEDVVKDAIVRRYNEMLQTKQ